MLEQRINATFGQYQVPAVVHAVQGDTGRVFIFESQDRQITGAETAALMCIRPDGTAFSYAGTVDPDLNEITVALDIDGGALSQAGVVAAQLVMQENGQVLCSFKLGIIVEEALGGEATPEDITFLDGLQAQLDAWIASAGSNFVPSTRTVNGKALSSNITINAEDVPYDNTASGLTADDVQEAVDELALKEGQLESTKANKSTTINGKDLSENRVLYVQDIPSNDTDPTSPTYAKTNVELTRIESGSIALASGWIVNDDTSPQLYKSNRLVTFNLCAYPTSKNLSIGWNMVGTIPQGFRPSGTITFNASIYGSGNSFLKTERAQLKSDGTLQVYSQTARSDVIRVVIFGSYISA